MPSDSGVFKFKDKSLFDQDKEYSQFSKQTALNVNTLKRYKEQEHLLQQLMNKPEVALSKIIDQAFENNKNVEIVRKNVDSMHHENLENISDLENWVNQMIFRQQQVLDAFAQNSNKIASSENLSSQRKKKKRSPTKQGSFKTPIISGITTKLGKKKDGQSARTTQMNKTFD